MPRCENCGTDWEGGHICINPQLSGVLNPWSRFTDDELAVFDHWNFCSHPAGLPDRLRVTDERLAVQLTAEIKARQSSGGTT
jgi:hypothetical protein